jgi:hypothetical protein
MARETKDLGKLAGSGRWEPVKVRRPPQLWTDDFSNLLSVFKWN